MDKFNIDDFTLLKQQNIHYLDNAATTQKPNCVLEAVRGYYDKKNANPMRGLYDLSIAATEAYENAREAVSSFINAGDSSQIIFTRNATESLNLVAYSYGMNFLKKDDEIIVSISEHHSNMLPWRQVASKTGAKVKYIECDSNGCIGPEKLEKMMSDNTKIVAVAQVSNVFGFTQDVKEISRIAHHHGAIIVCDGAQSVPHMPVDVRKLDVDFLAFSGHKMYAPMGIGVLYGKKELLDKMPPFLYGGEMIEYVTKDSATYAEVPHKFEAGTVNDGGAVGLHAAIDYMENIGWDTLIGRELSLTKMAMDEMAKIPHVSIIGSDKPEEHCGIITFKIDGVHPHDIAAIFDSKDIAVRAGHHCTQPLHQHMGLMSTTRASITFYNTEADVKAFIDCLKGVRRSMGYGE